MIIILSYCKIMSLIMNKTNKNLQQVFPTKFGVVEVQLHTPLEHICPRVGSHGYVSLHTEPIPLAYCCAMYKLNT